MKAFMSDPWSESEWWRAGKGSIPQWDLAAQAQREVARITAESEPGVDGWGFLPFPTAHPWRTRAGRYEAYLNHQADPTASVALAESLARIIPVLDQLESEAR